MENLSRREKEKRMREDEIIIAAEKVFIGVGFEKASMDEIAQESDFTRKTIYQHFVNKEDIYLAVVVKGLKQLLSCIRQEEKRGSNGFERFRNMGMAYYQFFIEHPGTFRLINLVGHIKSKEANTQNNQEFDQVNQLIVEEIVKIIEEGKADKSIRDDLNTRMATYSAQFVMSGFFYQLSLTGDTFTEHFSLDQNIMINFVLEMLFDAFRSKEA